MIEYLEEIIMFSSLIFICILAVLVALMFFTVRKFYFVEKLSQGKKWLKNVLALGLCVLAFIVGYFTNMVYMVVIVLHFIIFDWILFFLGWILGKITKKHLKFYWAGILAVVVTIGYLSFAYWNDWNIVRTDYTVETNKTITDNKGKKLSDFRIAQITDAHIGTTFDGKGLAKYIKEINKAKPDIFVITGDLIDDDTTKEQMIDTCNSLGLIKAKYGTYYIEGNHDAAYYKDRGYSMEEFQKDLENNGVTYMKDDVKLINDSVYVIGRIDRRFNDVRKSMAELTKGLDKSKYMIVLDHQPHDFKAQADSGVDLVLCGHTHGGQLFPIGYLGVWYGSYEKSYGIEKQKNTVFEVSSGISGWGVPYKTGAVSEYVILDIK